jgi:hypothetical protein
MLKKVNSIKLFLILFLLYFISFSKCDDYDVDYDPIDYETEEHTKSIKVGQKYFEIKNVPTTSNYFKISTIPNDLHYPAIIAFHKVKISRKDDAVLLGEKQYGNITLYIPKELIVDKKVYLNVTCYIPNCNYKLELGESDYIDIGRDETYSYYTNEGNNENIFKISRYNSDSQSGQVGDEKSVMTFFVNGNENVNVSVEYMNDRNKEKFKDNFIKTPNGKIMTFDERNYKYNEKNYYLVTIKSTTGDYLIFGSRSIGERLFLEDHVNKIIPNSRAVDGYINKNYLKRECFNIDPFEEIGEKSTKDYFIVNIISYSHNLKYFFIKSDTGEIDKQFETGSIKDEAAIKFFYKDEKDRYFCISSNNEDEDVLYNLQVTDFFRQINRPDIYSPQMGGYIYTRYVPAGRIVYFTHARKQRFRNLNFNLKTISGIPKMYFVYCNSFPDCNYNKQLLENEDNTMVIGRPHDVNGMFTHSLINLETNFKYIDNEQYLMVVACNGEKDCVFETSIFANNDVQMLKDNGKYYQYAMEGDEDQYTFTITDDKVKSLTINLQTFSGDTEFTMIQVPNNVKKTVFYASNKEIYEFTPIRGTLQGDYKFSIKGVLNSYYVVDYNTISDNIYLDTGIMTLETMKIKDSTKHIYIKNKRASDEKGMVINFFSLNCILSVLRLNSDGQAYEVPRNAYYLQDAITPEEEVYSDLLYHYIVMVQKMDSLYYDEDEKCLFYVNALEMDSDLDHKDYKDRQIVVPENIQMNVNLNTNIPGIKYLYPHAAENGNILLDINLSDESPLEIWVSYESSLTIHKYNIGRSRTIVLQESNFRTNITEESGKIPCPRTKEICNVIIEIFSKDIDKLAEGIDVELSIKSNETIPVYVRKGLLREDVITGNRIQYYFTDIKKNEAGDIYVNFNRGSGLVWAKLFEKTEQTSGEQHAWMGKYELPLYDDDENLYYDYYTKTIGYTSDQTDICDNECYLVIGVQNNLKELVGTQEFFVYDVSVMIRNKKEGNAQIINVPADEYIVGNIPYNIENSYYNYYSFYVPATSNKLLIEFQSQICNILINEGEKKPDE